MFKSQIFITVTTIIILIFSVSLIFIYSSYEPNYLEIYLLKKEVENYLSESEMLLSNKKLQEFLDFSKFFYNFSYRKGRDVKILFLNFTSYNNFISFSYTVFSKSSLTMNISSDNGSKIIVLNPFLMNSERLAYKNSKVITLGILNESYVYNFECREECYFLAVFYGSMNLQIVRTLVINYGYG